MLIGEKKLLNISFGLFVFSMIIMPSSVIGKALQLFFIGLSLLVSFEHKMRLIKYNIIEWAFVAYVFLQVISGVAELPKYTLNMAITLTYGVLFSIAFYNYATYINNPYDIVKIYVNATIIAFVVAACLYSNSISSFRLSAATSITVGGVTLFGGSSSTALALQAAVPAFFCALFPPDKSRKKANIYIVCLMFLALITGTRKILVVFAYILFFLNELVTEKKRNFKLLKAFIISIFAIVVGYIAIMNIPILYNIVGYRIENAVNYFVTGASGDSSIRARVRMRTEALELFKEKKIFGWGMDYYKYGVNVSLGYYSHNNFCELLSGGGIVGFAIYYLRYIYLLFKIIKSKLENNFKIAMVGMLVIMTVLEYWQVTYFYRYIIIMHIFMVYITNHAYNRSNGKANII